MLDYEENFKEMYDVLGDREAQEQIREQYPDKVHCSLLKMNPHACDGCPNNPHGERKKKQKKEVFNTYGQMLERIFRLYDLLELGLIKDISEVTPLEVDLLRIVGEYRRSEAMAGNMLRGLI